jgi:hypothetical protein
MIDRRGDASRDPDQEFTSEPAVAETYTLYDYDLATSRFTELTSGIRSMVLDSTGAAHATGALTGELVEAATVAWTPDGRGLLYLVRDGGDSAASWTIRSIDAAGGTSRPFSSEACSHSTSGSASRTCC